MCWRRGHQRLNKRFGELTPLFSFLPLYFSFHEAIGYILCIFGEQGLASLI
jgi:hypothetical protein